LVDCLSGDVLLYRGRDISEPLHGVREQQGGLRIDTPMTSAASGSAPNGQRWHDEDLRTFGGT
jgi:hypothetical protein